MTSLTWDNVVSRVYEQGLDHGVLYLSDGSGVAWSGLTSLSEDLSGETNTQVYFEGIKTFDNQSIGDFAATLKAFTYPEEFMEYEGIGPFGTGLLAADQKHEVFGLSYRTVVGNPVEGDLFGYKLHIVWGLTATIDDTTYASMTDQPSAIEFSWKVFGLPQDLVGFRPTAHVYLNSTLLDPGFLQAVEDILYGTDTTDPRLPSLSELAGLLDPVTDIVEEYV